MEILLYQDHTLSMDLDGIASHLTKTLESVWSRQGNNMFSIRGRSIRHPKTYNELPDELLVEARHANVAVFATRLPYENNYFFESQGPLSILSFYSWEHLTTLPVENGLLYFIASLMRGGLPEFGEAHKNATGCINDFLWDKRGVDLGMKSGRICKQCRLDLDKIKLSPTEATVLRNMERILSDVSGASSQGLNILEFWRVKMPATTSEDGGGFDVFMCHNSQDKGEIRLVSDGLREKGVRVWLDEEQLRPGLAWQVALEEQIDSIRSAAVFVGSSGLGPWQNMEYRAFLSEFASRQCPVIPVILRTAGSVPELPIFLRQLTWVDFREDEQRAMKRLVWGITGRKT